MNKHFAIDPNGIKHTRNSKTREYSHCVLVGESLQRRINDLNETLRDYATKIALECNDQQRAYYKRQAEGCQSRLDELNALKSAGATLEYAPVGWCGRYDLANKLAVQQQGRGWLDIRIIEAGRA